MTAQAATAEELTGYRTDIIDQHGDIPAVINNETAGALESVGHPIAPPVIPAGEADSFQAYKYERQEHTPRTEAALIN